MLVTVDQKIARHAARRRGNEKGNADRFRVPIGAAAVFFAGESLGTDVQPFVLARVGLVEVKDVEPDALLRLHIALDDDVAVAPDVLPPRLVRREQSVETGRLRGGGRPAPAP